MVSSPVPPIPSLHSSSSKPLFLPSFARFFSDDAPSSDPPDASVDVPRSGLPVASEDATSSDLPAASDDGPSSDDEDLDDKDGSYKGSVSYFSFLFNSSEVRSKSFTAVAEIRM